MFNFLNSNVCPAEPNQANSALTAVVVAVITTLMPSSIRSNHDLCSDGVVSGVDSDEDVAIVAAA